MSGCVNVGGCISFLKTLGLVTTLGRGKYTVRVGYDRDLQITPLTAIRSDKIAKLNEVVRFYRNSGCRMAFLSEYFGDTTFNGVCGHCDNCSKEK